MELPLEMLRNKRDQILEAISSHEAHYEALHTHAMRVRDLKERQEQSLEEIDKAIELIGA